ncbi:MAG TPA: molybdopterin-binding protein [Candidatus Dormibacteraeota bacterium]
MTEQPGRGVVLIAVGDEVLGGIIVDTNSHWLARRLREAGFAVRRIEVVGDVIADIAAAVRRAAADQEVARVVVSGGLGPTPDDRTLEAVALALDLPLEEHPRALAHVKGIVERIHAAGWFPTPEISKANRKMTLAPRGATILNNRRGMASGIAVALDSAGAERWLLLLPGVPRELHSLVDEEAIPFLFAGAAAPTVVELVYRYAIEAQFTEPMEELARLFPDVKVGSYPQSERRELIIRLRGDDPTSVAAAVTRMQALRPLELEEGLGGDASVRAVPVDRR